MKNRPTAEQAAEFDRCIANWQQRLNLCDWRIERGQKPAQRGAMAEIECNDQARLAVYRLGDFAGETITPEVLDKTALHECLHVFFFDLIEMARDHRVTDDHLGAVEHRLINVLERLLWSNQ